MRQPACWQRLPPPCALQSSVAPRADLLQPSSWQRLPPPCALQNCVEPSAQLEQPKWLHRLPPPCPLQNNSVSPQRLAPRRLVRFPILFAARPALPVDALRTTGATWAPCGRCSWGCTPPPPAPSRARARRAPAARRRSARARPQPEAPAPAHAPSTAPACRDHPQQGDPSGGFGDPRKQAQGSSKIGY